MPDKKITQTSQVVDAIKRLGEATLRAIQENVDTSTWRTFTPDATIRRIVRRSDQIKTVKRGLYCLAEVHGEVSAKYDENSSDKKTLATVHSLNQGMLAENAHDFFDVYITYQDVSKLYVSGKKLGDLANLSELPQFGPSQLIDSAKTVDVILFHKERHMPVALYEVETSTNIERSLNKFRKLRDFRADFFIVSPGKLENSFNRVMEKDYADIKPFVKFLSFDKIEGEIRNLIRRRKIN